MPKNCNSIFFSKLMLKKINSTGYYLHATDDIPEVRKEMFDLIKSVNCSFEAVVGRKSIERNKT